MKSFSWTLALRYLNPLRTFVSIITLISLLGVAFGVMVLIVVLSVHNGFEKNLKDNLLKFSPHIAMTRADGDSVSDWQDQEKRLADLPETSSAYALIQGFALVDSENWERPVDFRAIDSDNEDQIGSLAKLLDPDYPGGRADIGLEPYAVISKQLASSMGLGVGDELKLYVGRNLGPVMEVFDVPGERARELYPEIFDNFEESIRASLSEADGEERADSDEVAAAIGELESLVAHTDENGEEVEGRPMRKFERERIIDILRSLESAIKVVDGKSTYAPGTKASIIGILEELADYDLKEADNEAFQNIEEFVKPKTLIVWGVYTDTPRSPGPSLFISLELGMEMKGLKGEAEAIGIIIENPYRAEEIAAKLQAVMGGEWAFRSWMKTYAQQFELVKTEKGMMSFALSFITLLSAFSIMAVMYTVTVQKRQEIGVMKALGARPSQIVRVFLYQGVIVGIGGALLGLGLGLLAVKYRELIADALRAFGVDPFPAEFHGMSELPAHVESSQLVVICLVAIILCILAALVPALMAAFRDAAKSLRNL